MHFYLATSNPRKLLQYQQFFQALGHTAEPLQLKLPEIQSLDTRVVSRAKAELAVQLSGCSPLVVDDTGVEIEALQGFPGALLGPILAAGGISLFAKLTQSAQREGRVRARVVSCATLAVIRDKMEIFQATADLWGTLDFNLRDRFGDPDCTGIYFPDGERRSQFDLGQAEPQRWYSHRWEALRGALRQAGI